MSDINSSILLSIKRMLGGAVSSEDTTFDEELIIHINSVLSELNHMGIGTTGYIVTGKDNLWSDFFGADANGEKFVAAKTLVYFKVRKIFDPPTSAALAQAMNENIEELTWRLHSFANYKDQN